MKHFIPPAIQDHFQGLVEQKDHMLDVSGVAELAPPTLAELEQKIENLEKSLLALEARIEALS